MGDGTQYPRSYPVIYRVALVVAIAVAGVLGWRSLFPSRAPVTLVDREQPTDHLAPALPSPDPRLAYTGPFTNVHPDVAYVSDETCTQCHAEVAKRFCQHPMALTLRPIAAVASPPLTAAAHNPFTALGQEFTVVPRDGRVWHVREFHLDRGEPLFRRELEAQYAVGSGTHAHSYIQIQGSTLVQTPITWFTQKQRWDLSPGFQHSVLAGRRIGLECLFCHSNGANEDPRNPLVLRQPVFPHGLGIGCQRCHGPGSEHVKNPGSIIDTSLGRLDPTIVNPARLPPNLREAVCWQCHLEGDMRVLRRGRERYDFRPGLPLEAFVGVFHDPTTSSYDEIVNHVEQMTHSRCYRASAGPAQMGCVSCHDPHEKPTEDKKVRFYRDACLKCHREASCTLPHAERVKQQQDDSCIACHMAAQGTSNIEHVSVTDHRIPRTPSQKTVVASGHRERPMRDIVSVFESQRGSHDPELDRDRALASGLLTRRGMPVLTPFDREFEAAIQRDPGDVDVKVQYALRLIDGHNFEAAWPLIEDALARQPENEDALFAYALATMEFRRFDDAIPAWRRLIERAPLQKGYRIGLISLLGNERRYEEAEAVARAWVEYDPGTPEARTLLRDVLNDRGKRAEADEQERIRLALSRFR